MKLSKKFILAVFAVAIFSIALFSAGASGQTVTQFSDVTANHPYAATILSLREKGIVKGYGNDTFAPDNSISRAEFATMIMASLKGVALKAGNCFKDIKVNDWSSKFVCTAKARGLVSGSKNGFFFPNNNITLAEASVILSKAYKLNPIATTDKNWFKPYVEKLATASAIPVSIDYPEKRLSRAETGEMILRLRDKITNKPTKTYTALTSELPKLGSCAELKDKLAVYKYVQDRSFSRGGIMLKDMALPMAMEEAAAPPAAESASADYSQTNVQVEGVDEADVIKNDGEFIYMVKGPTVRIVKAYPPAEMAEVMKLDYTTDKFTPSEMYINGNKLVIIGTIQGTESNYWMTKTRVYVIDITDKKNPKEDNHIDFDGSTVSSRRIGNQVYVVLNNPGYNLLREDAKSIESVLPKFQDSKMNEPALIAPCSAIRFVPSYEEPNMLVVASINITDPTAAIGRTEIMGAPGNTVYASLDSLYVASQVYTYPMIGIFDTFATPDLAMPIWRGTESKTAFFQFRFNAGGVMFKGKGELNGRLLNQFAMDESGGYFRTVMTTDAQWTPQGETKSKTNVYVMNRDTIDLVTGKIENIAPGEQLHSVRFMGNRAYLVTFKQIDPFFVVDLSEPTNPKILGYLKIPGFSDYLHPFDENHIIGFGKEVDESIDADKVHSDDAVYYTAVQGVKIALFDVTDPANPTMMFKEIIGNRGTDSELFTNHKALLFDKARGMFGLPITVTDKPKPDNPYDTPVIFQGAYIYTLDLQNGFQLKGKITNYDDTSVFNSQNYYWGNDQLTLRRILWIGDFLYGVSSGKIKAVKRDTMEEVKKVDIVGDDNPYYGGPMPIPLDRPMME